MMNKELKLIESAEFFDSTCDFYEKNGTVYMTTDQLGACLGYADSKKGIGNLLSRYDYLKAPEFSSVLKMRTDSLGARDTRVFTEDGIYEVTFLSKTQRARAFRGWVRGILKSLRAGNARLVPMTEYQQMLAETRRQNARVRAAQILTKLAENYQGTTYAQVLQAHATKELTGEFLLPLPQLPAKTYSATEVGEMLGISSQMVGILANRNGLKTEKYGALFKDKAKHSNKEVQTFRYYENAVEVLRDIATAKTA